MENDRSEQIDLAKVYPKDESVLEDAATIVILRMWGIRKKGWAVGDHELNHGLGTSTDFK